MKLKTYQAYTMAEALGAVKRDLGDSAIILNTRSFKRGGFLGLGRKSIVQVTAGVPETSERERESSRTAGADSLRAWPPAPPVAAPARKAYRSAVGATPTPRAASIPSCEVDEHVVAPVTTEDQQRTRRLAQAMMANLERSADTTAIGKAPAMRRAADVGRPTTSAPTGMPDNAAISQRAASPAHPPASPSARRDVTPAPSPVARRFVLASTDPPLSCPDASSITESSPSAASPQPVTPLPSDSTGSSAAQRGASPQFSGSSVAVQEELGAIRRMVSHVLERQVASSGRVTLGMPARLFDMYLKLIGQDVSEEIADQVVNAVREELSASELEDETHVRRAVLRHLAAFIPVATRPLPEGSPDDRPLTIALIGPTGVGKTTTLAKLAATFKLRDGKKVGLITSDTYRIAAVDQLRTYANIIGLPLQIVLTPAEMRQAVHALKDCDVILIDTAGRGQNDAARLVELKQFLEAGAPHEVHLVLSSTASEKVLLREAEAFRRVGVHKVVLTKLDEAVSFGMLINVIHSVGTQLSFVTTGQEVPDHIEVGRADRLAELVLCGEVRWDRRPDHREEHQPEACAT